MIPTLKHNPANMMMTQMTSGIQRQIDAENKFSTFKDQVRQFVEKYDTNNMILGMMPNGATKEITTGIFEEAFTTTSFKEALDKMHMGECIWIRGLEKDHNRTYMVGSMMKSISECAEDTNLYNVQNFTYIDRIMEGGHVFDTSVVKPIAKENIQSTLDSFTGVMKKLFPKVAKYWDNPVTLGSVGKKDVSGDIDIAIDDASLKNPEDWGLDPQKLSADYAIMLKRARTATPQDVMRRAFIKGIGDFINSHATLINADSKSAGNGVLFTCYPQYGPDGKALNDYVQIDINFGNIDWLKFAYYSDSYAGNVKGLHRTQLMLHLFTAKGFMFMHNKGVQEKETLQWVATNPKEAIDKLNELYHFNLDEKTLQNYHKLQEYLRANLDKTTLNHVYDIYLKTLDSTRCDIPEDLQPYWVENKDRLGLTGKFLPNNSQLAPMCK